MRIDEILQRKAEIRALMEKPDFDKSTAAGLLEEVRKLNDEQQQIEQAASVAEQLRKAVGMGTRESIREKEAEQFGGGEDPEEKRMKVLASTEYRNAFLKHLKGADMTEKEGRAFTYTTTNTTAPLPTEMLNNIISLIEEQHPIVADVNTLRSGCEITIPRAKSIAEASTKTAEGSAAPELQVTMDNVTLSGNDFAATVKVTYKMATMALPAFQAYLEKVIADKIGADLAADIVDNIKTGMATANTVKDDVSFASICKAFGLLKRVQQTVVYTTRATKFNSIVSLVDANKRPIFQQPIAEKDGGALLGCVIKYEDAVPEGTVLIGDPTKYTQNVAQEIILESDRDIETHKIIHSGYTCQEGALTDDKAFSIIDPAQKGK